jgi:hypothetical protein
MKSHWTTKGLKERNFDKVPEMQRQTLRENGTWWQRWTLEPHSHKPRSTRAPNSHQKLQGDRAIPLRDPGRGLPTP